MKHRNPKLADDGVLPCRVAPHRARCRGQCSCIAARDGAGLVQSPHAPLLGLVPARPSPSQLVPACRCCCSRGLVRVQGMRSAAWTRDTL
ncbi:hypothetical protein P280DRAFT_103774 [Massarina eburnea CBS 473.64]|uniref:Uncharacterized protein n=1 Tax=Massarina eburnea CBS 473.64 TaxID=1395130 RepID=A0A6A6RPZ8_9PLEO|nr:hypothetical protein P280DRAFT_103774 [Massarina eburnea CBS 473.64]